MRGHSCRGTTTPRTGRAVISKGAEVRKGSLGMQQWGRTGCRGPGGHEALDTQGRHDTVLEVILGWQWVQMWWELLCPRTVCTPTASVIVTGQDGEGCVLTALVAGKSCAL